MGSTYIVIPMDVRNDTQLNANVKLFYGDLLYLSRKEGYCFASNKYLSERLGLAIPTISRWIRELNEAGYIDVQYIRRDGGMNIEQRRITLLTERLIGYSSDDEQGINPNDKGVLTEQLRGYSSDGEGGINRNDKYKNNILRLKDKNIKEDYIYNENDEPPVIKLPLKDGTEYSIYNRDIIEWQGLYVDVDIMDELRKMRGWLLANDSKRKTYRGIKKFITGWLSRARDNVKNAGQKTGTDTGNPFLNYLMNNEVQ